MYVCPLQVFLTFAWMPLLHVCLPTTCIPDLHVYLFYMYVSPLQVFLTFAWMPLLHVCLPTTSIPNFYMYTSSTCMSAHYKYS